MRVRLHLRKDQNEKHMIISGELTHAVGCSDVLTVFLPFFMKPGEKVELEYIGTEQEVRSYYMNKNKAIE